MRSLKHICSSNVIYIMEKVTTKSLVLKSIWEFLDVRFINQWSNVISHLPRNISVSAFTILTTRKQMVQMPSNGV